MLRVSGFKALGNLGFSVWGFGSKVRCLGLRVEGSVFGASGPGHMGLTGVGETLHAGGLKVQGYDAPNVG